MLLTDLSKAFHCLDHELCTAKFNAYGFNISALRLVHDYLSNSKERIKFGNTYSNWVEIIFEVPQGLILLFNIFLAHLFFFINDIDISSYGDNYAPYVISDNIDYIIKSLEEASIALFQWVDNNLLKSNPDKCHLLISSNENVTVHVDKYEIVNSKCEKLLGVKLDWKLNLDDHSSDVCKKS